MDQNVGDDLAHWSRADILALLGILATLLVAVVKPVRDLAARAVDGLSFRLGFPGRRYRRTFSEKYRFIDNVYLDKRERLDLGGTYVTLSAVGGAADPRNPAVATTVLADRENQRLIITGAPGSGKSTLLKAYAVGTMGSYRNAEASADLLRIRRSREIPLFVQLRRLSGTAGIWDHLVSDILISEFGFKRPGAEKFLRRLLQTSRCLILLDGLDEVSNDRYQAVRTAILRFAEDQDPERPTSRARIVFTCRRQNFNAAEWETFSEVEHVLSPMQDNHILNYLTNRRKDFHEKGMNPERFFTAIEGSSTFDLHRTPLVLTMSVALYLERRIEAVPNSISALYEKMIRTMLDRHRFVVDGPPVNEFTCDDKERFLQRFALIMAERAQAFEDFTIGELRSEAAKMAPSLSQVEVERSRAFVDEIVDRSGLLIPVAPGYYAFAHRSIQEYLIGVQLRDREADGASRALAHANDQEWRQVILFFAAGRTAMVEAFLERLYTRNPELAVRCLANAETQNINALATRLLRDFTLGSRTSAQLLQLRLTAVLYACRAVPEPVRKAATSCAQRLLQLLTAQDFTLIGGDENLLRVLRDLVATNAGTIASLVPDLAESIPDDPQLVPVLWRCLNVLDPATMPIACEKLIKRLLVMAMDPTYFAILQRQPRLGNAHLDDGLRRRAYPFDEALPKESNLVTLLTRAEKPRVTPSQTNLFLDARNADPGYFAHLERDNRRTIRISGYWPVLIISVLVSIAALCRTGWIVSTDPHSLIEPHGWWTVGLLLIPPAASYGLILLFVLDFVPHALHPSDDLSGIVAHWVGLIPSSDDSAIVLPAFVFIIPLTISISFSEIIHQSILRFIIVATAATFVGNFLPCMNMFIKTAVYTLNKRNPYVDAYTDPLSAHWLRAPATES